jgi:SPP1 family predicted phage head-tail adaptor
MSGKCVCVNDMTAFCRVQRLDVVPDGMGGQVERVRGQRWVDYFTFWAFLEWGSGGESQNMNRTQASGMASLVAYFDARLDTSMRIILDDGQILNVRSVDNRNQRSLWLDIEAEQGVGT